MCAGDDAAGLARKQRAAAAGAIQAVVAALQAHPHEAAVAALQAHPQVAEVQQQGRIIVINMCAASDAHSQRVADAGAIEAIVAALQAADPEEWDEVEQDCCQALANVCSGTCAAGLARKQRAADAGAQAARSRRGRDGGATAWLCGAGQRVLRHRRHGARTHTARSRGGRDRGGRSRRSWRRCRLFRERKTCRSMAAVRLLTFATVEAPLRGRGGSVLGVHACPRRRQRRCRRTQTTEMSRSKDGGC
uniref:Armadillo repeat-containing domain-containing protein n=1 Tax=Emiliania huxleyi TaxID=2903 RepID=A0A7S3WLC5_EMIHU